MRLFLGFQFFFLLRLRNAEDEESKVILTGHIKAVETINGIQTVESAITWHPDLSNQPLLGIQTCRISHYLASRLVESAVHAARECGRGIHLEPTYFVHFVQCVDASHELEGVMTRVVSTNVTFEGTLLNQDTRSMVQQSKVGITRSAVDGALVLEHEDMFTGKRLKLSRSQCLCLSRIEIPKV